MKKRTSGFPRGFVISLAVFACLLAGGYALFHAIDTVSVSSETALVQQAVRSAALTCYAVEGAYPTSIDYLKEHYGLSYSEERYIVAYRAFASNVMPEIQVLKKGEHP